METTSDMKNTLNSKAEKFSNKVGDVADKYSSRASDTAERYGSKAASTAEHMVDRARRAGEELLETPIAERMTEAWDGIRTRSVDAYDTSVASVRRNPAAWLGAALGVGVIAGLFFGRRSSR